jgi:hypothetical protein
MPAVDPIAHRVARRYVAEVWRARRAGGRAAERENEADDEPPRIGPMESAST